MSEISSPTAAEPRTGTTASAALTPVTCAILVLVLVAGLGGTYFLSRDIRTAAAEVWDHRANVEGGRLTATLLQWIETSVTPVHAMATLYQSSTEVSDDEFWDAVSLLEDNQQDLFPSALVVVLPAEITGGETWQVIRSIAVEGRLSVGSDLAEDPDLERAVAAAFESPGRAVIGSLYRDDLGTAWMVSAIAVERQEDRHVILGLIDLSQMVDGLFKTQVPEGIGLRLSARSATETPDSAALLFGPNEAAEGTALTSTIRGVVGGAKFNFLWDVTDGFQGGRGSIRADMVLVGGVLATALLTLFIFFLLRQNEQIARVVRERTVELRLALDNMPGGMFMIDKDLKVRVHNDRYSEIYGLPQGTIRSGGSLRDPLRARAERGDYGPGDVDELVEQRIESYRKRRSERVEERLPNGRIVEFVQAPTGDGGTVAVVTDIAERKEAEAALRQSEERYALAMAGAGEGLWDWDVKNDRLDVSPRFLEIMGLPTDKDSISPMEWVERMHPDDRERYRQDIVAHLRGDTKNLATEVRVQDPGGGYRWVRPRGLALRDGEGRAYRMAGSLSDMTERRQAEEALRESETRLNTVLNNMPAVVFLKSMDGRFRFINKRYEQLYGVRFEEIRDKTLAEIYPTEQAEKFTAIDQAVIDSGEVIASEHVLPRETGDITLASVMFPILGEDGSVNGFGGVEIDITERKQAEASLAERETQLRLAMDYMPGAIFVVDEELNLVLVNDRYGELYGHPDDMVVVGASMEDVLRQELKQGILGGEGSPEEILQDRLASFRSRESSTFEDLTPAGRYLQIRRQPAPENKMVTVITDITEIKQIEEALRTSEERLVSILAESPMGAFVVHEADNRIIFTNPRLAEMFGYAEEDLIGKTGEILHFDPEMRQRQIEQLDRDGFLRDAEIQMRRADGSELWVLVSLFKIVFEGKPARLCWLYDITERKQAEEEIKQGRRQLEFILESSPIAVGISLDDQSPDDGIITFANSRFREMLGFNREDIGKVRTKEFLPKGDDRDAHESKLDEGESLTDMDVRFTRRDGSKFWTLMSISPIRSDDRQSALIWLYDITERKRAEEELRLAKEQAETALTELTKTQQQLVTAEKMASLGQLTAGIAHEIKNPLNFVNNFSETSVELLDELAEVLEPVQDQLDADSRDDVEDVIDTLKGDLRKINHHGKRADSIVKSMLLHARGDTSERVLTSINELVEEAFSLAYHGERARDKAFQVTANHSLDDSAGQADLVPQEITRVLVNLFSNAFYAVKSRVRAAETDDYTPTIEICTKDKGDDVEVRVRDNGTGMPKEVREKLFDPFFTTKPTGEGTGLGLSMSFDIIVQQHGGRIEVDSEPGAFTEFVVSLPRHEGNGRPQRGGEL